MTAENGASTGIPVPGTGAGDVVTDEDRDTIVDAGTGQGGGVAGGSPEAGALLEARALVKTFPSGEAVLRVLDGVDLEIEEGERLAVLGASGVGKSTLLHLLGGLDRPDGGEIVFRGRRLDDMSDDELAAFRNASIGFVFQFFQLLPEFTALENVMMPLLIAGRGDEAPEAARALLDDVGLDGRGHHFPTQLSGGERQRVAIARALVRGPALILADEPTGNVDLETGRRVMDVFGRVQQEHGAAILMVTHDPALVEGFDRVLEMVQGGRLRSA